MSLPANVTELLAQANDKYCICGETASVARWRAANPWKWKRFYPRWYVEYRKDKEKNMLTVTGEASFADEGKVLELTVRIQPHTPMEHDLLAKIAPMTEGQLVLSDRFRIPTREPEAGSAPPSESSSTSVAENLLGAGEGSQVSEAGEVTEVGKANLSSAPATQNAGEGEASGALATAEAPAQADNTEE